MLAEECQTCMMLLYVEVVLESQIEENEEEYLLLAFYIGFCGNVSPWVFPSVPEILSCFF